jgi:hypothetical protein
MLELDVRLLILIDAKHCRWFKRTFHGECSPAPNRTMAMRVRFDLKHSRDRAQ